MSKISIVPVASENQAAKDFLAQATQGKSDFFKVEFFDDSVRVKNICSDIVINSNGSSRHIPCASSVDLTPGQRFKVNEYSFLIN